MKRRTFLQAAALTVIPNKTAADKPLEEFRYSDVALAPGRAQTQFEETRTVLLGLNEDSLLKPWRLRAGISAPGPDLGGWYDEVPLDKTESGGHGFAPAHCFGQWISALARGYAIDRDAQTKAKLEKLLALYEPAISGKFYKNFRFPAYNYDKLVIGLIDAEYIAELPQAKKLLELTTNAAEPFLPPHALDRDEPQRRWRASVGDNTTDDYTWDESYTIAENLYLAYARGAGERYRTMARRFLLDETYFDPLAEGRNVIGNHHAYSFCNALSSAMQTYLVDGSRKHLRAANNAFEMITAQSFATGAWGPNESFIPEGSDELYKSLTDTHRGFETPCGSYAHFKLTRYLLRVTKDGRYGDSMERVLYNTVLGAKTLQADGRAFYYSDYSFGGEKTYFPDKWPCCAGTLPQVATDYRILIYFRDTRGLFVNLYLPSELHFVSPDGAQVKLTQTGNYPKGEDVSLRLETSRPAMFPLRLRIPAWANSAIKVNGAQMDVRVERGFATIERKWKSGDTVDLRLTVPAVRLEPINAKHPDTVAVVRGALVQFAIGKEPVTVRRSDPLAGHKFLPFTEIEDEPYSAYVSLT